MEENFPEEYLNALKEYEAYDEDGQSVLSKALIPAVEEEMDVTVETENQLTIETENGTYEIVKTIESGNPEDGDYQFDTETIEKGNLSDLNS